MNTRRIPVIIWILMGFYLVLSAYCLFVTVLLFLSPYWVIGGAYIALTCILLRIVWGFYSNNRLWFKVSKWVNILILLFFLFSYWEEHTYGRAESGWADIMILCIVTLLNYFPAVEGWFNGEKIET